MTTATVSIVDFLTDPELGGRHPAFVDLSTWGAWLVFLKALYGLAITDQDELELFRKHTGRSVYRPPPGGFREAVAVVGRQSGKSRVASLIVAFESACADAEPDGTPTYSLLISQNLRSVLRVLFGYVRSWFDTSNVPLLASQIASETADSLTLANGCTIGCWPCVPRSVRGPRARVVVLDECAYFLNTENYSTDEQMVKAVRPSLLNTSGRLVVISSPSGQSGHLWRSFQKHYGVDGSDVLIWKATSPEMNPTLTREDLSRMEAEDPLAYRNEILAEFAAGSTALFGYESLEACVNRDRPRELAPRAGVRYEGFVDASGGRVDAFALSIAHKGPDGAVIVDCVRTWPAPFDPECVTSEVCGLLGRYGVRSVCGDRYAASWTSQSFERRRVRYEQSALDRSGLYLELLHAVNSRTVELPGDDRLLRELRGLQRRRSVSGRDRIDHLPGQHDDAANAVAGVVWRVLGAPTNRLTILPLSRWWRPGPERLEVADGRPWHRSSRELVRTS